MSRPVRLLLLLLLASSMAISVTHGLAVESTVRVQTDTKNGWRIVTMTDFDRIVNFVFDQENRWRQNTLKKNHDIFFISVKQAALPAWESECVVLTVKM
jgi:hypothetical protein